MADKLYKAWIDGGIQRFETIRADNIRDAYSKAKELLKDKEVIRGVEHIVEDYDA